MICEDKPAKVMKDTGSSFLSLSSLVQRFYGSD